MSFGLGFWAAAATGAPQTYELISTTLISTNTASVTFDVTGLESTYKHLQIRFTARATNGAFSTFTTLRFNGASTGHNDHYLLGNGSSVQTAYTNGVSNINFGSITAANATSNNFGSHIIDLLDPFSSSKNKTMKSIGGVVDPNSLTVAFSSGLWASTAATTTLLLAASGGSYVAGSRFSLYGIRG
jgi:hypothetical protein